MMNRELEEKLTMIFNELQEIKEYLYNRETEKKIKEKEYELKDVTRELDDIKYSTIRYREMNEELRARFRCIGKQKMEE